VFITSPNGQVAILATIAESPSDDAQRYSISKPYSRYLSRDHPRRACKSNIRCIHCNLLGHSKKFCSRAAKPTLSWVPKAQPSSPCHSSPETLNNPGTVERNPDLPKNISEPSTQSRLDSRDAPSDSTDGLPFSSLSQERIYTD
jgi:hypothetical protein